MLRDFPLPATFRPPAGSVAGPVTDPVPIRHAATVMLVRPADAGVEVFTFRRRPSLAFAAGMVVFPGGAVEPGDADPALPWSGPPRSAFAAALSTDEALAGAIVAAAVRETFEECGVLLARRRDGGVLAESLDVPAWEERRQALLAGDLGLADLLADAGLVLAADLLHPWAHWLTPPGERRRFDTRFFLATVPAGQRARDLGGEGEEAAWTSPSVAVAGHRAGEVPLLPPTLVTLEELAAAPSVEALVATRRRLRPVSPWAVRTGTDVHGAPRYALRVDLDGEGGGEPGPAAGEAS
jgi:8-oxo-dGTP pyrophosphatase MutT (NUDIX family)